MRRKIGLTPGPAARERDETNHQAGEKERPDIQQGTDPHRPHLADQPTSLCPASGHKERGIIRVRPPQQIPRQ